MTIPASDFPLDPVSAQACAAGFSILRNAGFDEITLCRELRIPSMSELGKVCWRQFAFAPDRPTLGLLASLFLFGEREPRAAVEKALGQSGLASLEVLGLLRPAKTDLATVVSPVFLYPAAGFLIASDRHNDPDGSPDRLREAQADVVFPGIFGGTLRFLELLPRLSNGDALDLCGGCGIGALHLAKTARTALSADITLRATSFAQFNAQFNGCANVEALCSDLYQAVAGRQFDLISAHPPYVPALGDKMIYRDAGDTGEDITQGTVAGLPVHLRPGGSSLILCQGRDLEEATFEQRAREWLGPAQNEFDVLFALQTTKTLEQEAREMARRVNEPTREELAALIERFRQLGTRQFVYGALFFQRHRHSDIAPWTHRTRLVPETRAADFAALVGWHHRRLEPGFQDWLAQTPLRLASTLELKVRHLVQDGCLIPAEFIFEVDRPFASALRLDGWLTPLIGRLDGATTPAQIYSGLRAADELPPSFELKDFIELLATLVERGFIQMP